MHTARWDELEAIFGQAAALPPEARTAFLDEACRGDDTLRRALDSLLANYDAAPGVFDGLAGALPPPAPADPYDLIGSRIRHYRVIEALGRGGMGVVYRAEDTRLRRPVALKFLPPYLHADEQARRRFVAEAQAASALDHANICTIYEIGETEPAPGESEGRPFIAMAYYEGETLKDRLIRGPLPVKEALDYAGQIARGLAHAHAAGIVHRDIKPANVMVTAPEPPEAGALIKILDFGLAKAADVQLTKTGTTLGTAAYMSPEQARGEAVDPRTDVWSLGVVLYEMLTGTRPFQGDYDPAILYAILHQDPPPLSEVDPGLPPELEHVVAMCLEKERDLRYPSMADLLADLDVAVHGPAPGARARLPRPRGIRRPHKAVLGGAGVVLALLLLLAVPGIRRAVWPGSGAPAPMRLAVLPFTTLRADANSLAFDEGLHLAMTSVLSQMEPYAERPLWVVPASEVGGITSAAEARRRFGARYVITGNILHDGRAVRLDLTLVDAEKMSQVRAAAITAAAGEVATLQAGLVSGLAELLQIALTPQARRALTAGGTADSRAYAFYLEGRSFLERTDKPESIDTAIELFKYALEEDSLYALAHAGLSRAFTYKYTRHKDTLWIGRAERSSRRALALDGRLAEAHMTLGLLYNYTGAYEQALRAYQLALTLDPANADIYVGMANAQERLHRVAEAEATYRKGIALRPGYQRLHNELGNLYLRSKRYEDAADQFRAVIELTPDNIWGYNNLGATYLYQNRLEDARRWFERSLEVRPNHTAYSNLGVIAYYEQRYGDEARMYEQALALDSTDHRVWGNLAEAYARTPETYHKAPEAYQRAIREATVQYAVNPNNLQLTRSLAGYYGGAGRLDYEAGRYVDAAEMYRQALTLDAHDDELWGRLAETQERIPGEASLARESRRRAATEAEARRAETPDDAGLLSRLAGYYARLGQTRRALPVLEQALDADPDDASLMIRAARLYERLGRREEALRWIEKALQRGYPASRIEQDSALVALRADPRFPRLRP